MNIYVGNISYDVSEPKLKQTFEEYGEVSTVKIVKDQYSGKSKGFGFVEMPNDEEAKKAIDELNDSKLGERVLIVNPARPKTESSNRRDFKQRRKYDN